MCICVCVCKCVFVRLCLHACVDVCICASVRMCVRVCKYVSEICLHDYKCVCVCVCVCACVCVCVCVHGFLYLYVVCLTSSNYNYLLYVFLRHKVIFNWCLIMHQASSDVTRIMIWWFWCNSNSLNCAHMSIIKQHVI